VSLRKSHCLTPALLAANRRNAKTPTGPRTARGKAWSRLNHMRDGWRSPESLRLITALVNAPPGRVGATARALLSSKVAVHPLFAEFAEIGAQTEIKKGNERRWRRAGRDDREKRNSFLYVRIRSVYENKQPYDHLPEKKATFLHNFRTFNTNRPVFCRVLQKAPAFLSLFERYGMNSAPEENA
jgi:hypothetical protein